MMSGEQDQSGETESPKVFLSYSRPEQPFALKVIAALEDAGIQVWWDGLLEAGTTFVKSTGQALEEADAIVVLWSELSVESHWVRDEATVGRDRRTLVPVSIDGVLPPLGFGQFHAISLQNWKGDRDAPEFANIVQSIWKLATGEPQAETEPPRTPTATGVSRRGMLLTGGAGIVAAGAGLLAWQGGWFGGDGSNAIQSVAVLPFDNLSGDASQDYFSDGVSEELRAVLAQNPQLRVVAQTSSNFFRDRDEDARTIARELQAGFLIDGSVRRSGDIVRIAVQLIDGANGFDRWSQSFDLEMADIFTVQSEIANTVSRALSSQLVETGDNEVMRSGGTRDASAYDAYLRGVALYDLAAGEETDRAALAQFESAIEIDASYAAAHAERARTLTAIANGSSDVDQLREMYDSAIASAETAVALAPDYADGHAALGYALLNARLDVQAAARSYRRSYELGAGNADILAGFATFSFRNGQFDDAREAINTAIRLDPLNPYALRTAGNGEYAAGRYREAIAFFRQALELNTDLSGAHAALGDTLFMLGEHEQAHEEYSLEPSALYRLKGLAISERLLDRESAAQSAMAELIAEYGDNGLYQQAQVLSVWGDRSAALDALRRAREVGDSGLVLARNDPMLNGLRDAPEFIALLRDIGFA